MDIECRFFFQALHLVRSSTLNSTFFLLQTYCLFEGAGCLWPFLDFINLLEMKIFRIIKIQESIQILYLKHFECFSLQNNIVCS